MKTILLVLVIICFTCSLHAQTLEPSPLIFGYGPGDTTAFRVRPTTHFTLGANWGSPRNFAETYWLNASHGGWNASWTMRPNDYTDSMRLILFTEPISTSGQGGGLFYAQSMHFDPTVTVDETDGFTARVGDTTGGVFGWRERDTILTVVTSDTTNADFDRMQTRLANYTGTPTTILSSLWPDYQLITNNGLAIPDDEGTRWYLSLNVRLLDSASSAPNDTILSVFMPYIVDTTYSDTLFAKFDSVFVSLADTQHTARGIVDKRLAAANLATTFIIRRNMLPPDGTPITIGAFFRTIGDPDTNPRFRIHSKDYNPANNGRITHADIRVQYHGHADAAIDWIRIETPKARQLFRGKYDDSIRHVIQRAIDSVRTVGRGVEFSRLFVIDEAGTPFYRAERYANRLMNGATQLERYVELPAHYLHTVQSPEVWYNVGTHPVDQSPAPYILRGHQNLSSSLAMRCFNLKWGRYGGLRDMDTMRHIGDPLTGDGYELFGDGYHAGFLVAMVSNWKSIANSPSLLFGERPWWGQSWVFSEFTRTDTTQPAYVTQYRPETGEELRVIPYRDIVLGAKGLFFYTFGDGGYGENHWFVGMASNRVLSDTLQGDAFLRNDALLGGDYLQLPVDSATSNSNQSNGVLLSSRISGKNAAWDSLGIDSTHLYLGKRSQREGVKKITDYIQAVGDTLLRLRLIAWYGRFGAFGADTEIKSGDTTTFEQFVLFDSLQTQPTLRTIAESKDSSYYDITFLSESGKSSDSVFYIGILNKRTNPLIRNSYTGDTLAFMPTAEFDSLTTSANSFWQAQRYMQGGSRVFTIPFTYKDTLGRYALLRVRELGAGNAYLDSVYPHRTNRALYDIVDTVVGQDKSVTFKLLPGEGKIFRVEVLRSNEVSGELAHTNQTKIVSHNLMRRENGTGKWVEGDSLVYYMTYHKPAPSMPSFPPRTAVYFRKSKPTSRWDNNAALQWESEYRLTDTVYHSGRGNIGDSCAYPSIVVRFDSTSEEYRAYIVYGCIKYDTTNNPLYEGQFITESIIRIRQDTVIAQILPGIALDMVRSRDMSEWGTPMINASDTANFYCYSDQTNKRGIIAGWKRPDTSRALVSKVAISWANQYQWDEGTPEARHPSLNPYSPYIRGERHSDAALVWQENNTLWDYPWRIMYTRLSVVDSQIVYGVSPTNNSFSTPYILNDSNKIWCVSCDTSWWQTPINHSYPVVYRELFYPDPDTSLCNWDYWFSGHTRHDVRIDNIAWQGEYTPSSPFFTQDHFIDRRAAIMMDTTIGGAFVPNTIDIQAVETIWSSSSAYVYGPTLSAGESEYAALPPIFSGLGGCLNSSVRAVALDFGYYPSLQVIGQPPWSAIYHTALPNVVALATIPITTVASGNTPTQGHLSARGSVRLNDWQRGRHIYNSDTLIPSTIRTSGREFYKRANDNPIAETMYGFGNSDSRFVMSALRFGGQDYPLLPKRALVPSLFTTPPDTLATEWFSVGNERIAQLLSAGDAPEQVAGFIERRNDGQQWELPFGRGEKRRLARLYARLVNGGDEEYRLVIHRNSDIGVFRREIVLDNPFGDEGLGRSAEDMEQMLDLGSTGDAELLTIFPNPVSNEVHIAIRGEECAEVIIVDAFGRTMQATTMKSGGVLTVATADFAAGLYAVRVRRMGSPDVGGRFIVVR